LRRPWDAEELARDPRTLVALEYQAVEDRQVWLRAMLHDISIEVRPR
jgi:hypothetical protein